MTDYNKNTSDNHVQLSDEKIRTLLHNLPDAPENPWLLKKILNRLPDNSTARPLPAVIGYILAAIILFAGWGYAGLGIVGAETLVLTYADIIYLCALLIFTVMLPLTYQRT